MWDLPGPGTESVSPVHWQVDSLPLSHRKAPVSIFENFCKNLQDCVFPYQRHDGFSQNGPQV